MTHVAVERAPGDARCYLRAGRLSPRLLSTTADGARVALVATDALLLGGDHVRLDVRVGPGAWLEVVETAGTVAYDGRGARSGWDVRIELAEDAHLVWEGLPFVVSDGADVDRSTHVSLAAGARALLRETIVLGRSGQPGGVVRLRTDVLAGGAELLREHLDLTREHREAPGVLGAARVLDTVLALGWRPGDAPDRALDDTSGAQGADDGAERFDLEGPGAMVRRLARETHRGAALDDVWRAWVEECETPHGARGRSLRV